MIIILSQDFFGLPANGPAPPAAANVVAPSIHHSHPFPRQSSGERLDDDALAETRNDDVHDHGHLVDETDSDYDHDGYNSDDVDDDHQSQRVNGGAAVSPQFVNVQNYAHPVPAVDAIGDAAPLPHVGAPAHAADDEDRHSVDDGDALENIDAEDEWEIDGWNEGMREGWDWVPLAVVSTIFVRIFMAIKAEFTHECDISSCRCHFLSFLGCLGACAMSECHFCKWLFAIQSLFSRSLSYHTKRVPPSLYFALDSF
jgi:hypothetical protein